MRRLQVLLLLLVALIAGRPSGAAAQCDIPLIVGSVGTTANVLLLLDSSGSMNEVVFHDSFNPGTTYSGNFTSTSIYNINSDAYYSPRSFNSKWAKTPTAYLVNSDQGEPGQYLGNYLNWVFFHATATQRGEIPTYTRIQAAKSVLSSLMNTTTNVRFAIEIFNGSDGGTILAPFGSSLDTLQARLARIRADATTPLAEAMVDALDYYRTTGASAPIQAACQRSFVVLVTDGYPTFDLDVPDYLRAYDCGNNDPGSCASLGAPYPWWYFCTAYLDNVACYMYREDMRNDLDGIQNVATFVVGFNINAPLLQTTANEGGGEYYSTNNVAGLTASLASAFTTIGRRVAAGASVAVVTAEDRINNRLFRARYESAVWRGYVEAYNLPFQSGSAPLWEAGALLESRNPSTRTLYTSTTGTNRVDFTTSNASTLRTLLAAADDTEASNIISYTRGNHISGKRDREGWKLGDVVDAAPVAVGKPTTFSNLPGYAAFRAAHANRDEVVYVAANDGLLHCFDTADGTELWAYAPKTQLPRLKNLMEPAYCHQYFVNTTPLAIDIPVSGTWKTVLIGGEENGNNGMYALDITDPTGGNVGVLWDKDIPRLRGSINTPTLVRDATLNDFVLAVGTGFSSTAVADSLVILDPENGNVLGRVGLGSAVAPNKTTRATAFDKNFDGYDDLLYLADLAGRVFRINLQTNPWTATVLYSGSQPIQAPPVVTLNAAGQPMVFFGTGQFLLATDPTTTASQTIYCVIDDGLGTTFTRSDLTNQTSAINTISSGSHGWYVDLLNGAGERVTRGAALIAGVLYVTSFKPSSAACAGGGQAWLYTLDYEDGSSPEGGTTGRAHSMGDGMLADPTVDLVNEAILLQSSNAVVMSRPITGGLRRLVVRGWHQTWN